MICKLTVGVLVLLGVCTRPAAAQLAITEVMSLAALETDPGFNRPDYWELTNFGAEDISLDGYSFSDDRRTTLLFFDPFTNLVIHPGESIVFFRFQSDRSSVTNAERFKAWWGELNLPRDLQIRTWEGSGLNGETGGDELWVYDPQLNVVDSVRFREARIGRSFTYEPENGIFGLFSVPGVYGAFQAAQGGDVGSPGTTIGPSALRMVQQPRDQMADAGADATFTVVAAGLPRPKYQWLARGIEITGATAASLTLSNVQPADAGEYCVRIHNGLSEFMSVTVTLTVNTNTTPPAIVRPPSDMSVFPGQTAVFSVLARGFPAPQYQWQSNGVDLAGATHPTLEVRNVAPNMSGTRYTIRVWNGLRATNASASLVVVRRPRLRFTEVMARPIFPDSNAHFDWFELTNGDTNTVSLQGYRFFDTPTFAGAFTIDDPILIRPGESVVFVEEMSAEAFWRWWGTDNTRPGVQVLTYHGFALGDYGEALFLWNPAATDPFDTVATASWAAATPGVSLECADWCDETYGCVGECLTDSILGVNGAFRAASNGDIGSPGYTSRPPPRILSITCDGAEARLKCRVNPGSRYRLSWAPRLSGVSWTQLGSYLAADFILWAEDASLGSEPARFYRLEELP